jgi:hypothetical protein
MLCPPFFYTCLPSQGDPDLEIATVDSMQGNEADIIIISTVRSNEAGQLGFLNVANRVNVALSRAKQQVIVVGDRSTLTHASSGLWFDICMGCFFRVMPVTKHWLELQKHRNFAAATPGQIRILRKFLFNSNQQ